MGIYILILVYIYTYTCIYIYTYTFTKQPKYFLNTLCNGATAT
jgi:hypothetical protein